MSIPDLAVSPPGSGRKPGIPTHWIIGGVACCLGLVVMVAIAAVVVGVLVKRSSGGADVQRTDNGEVELEPMRPKAGYIRGRAVTQDGRPLETFIVEYSGYPLAPGNAKVEGRNGEYEIKVGDGLYGAQALYQVKFDDRLYTFRLAATNGKDHSNDQEQTDDGIVRDFVWKLTGLKTGSEENADSERAYRNAYYGGAIEPHFGSAEDFIGQRKVRPPLTEQFAPESVVEITLAPQGPLIDGTEGQPLVKQFKLSETGNIKCYIRGIPVGVYMVTAKLTEPSGTSHVLRISEKMWDTIDSYSWRFNGTTPYELHFKPYDAIGNDVAPIDLHFNT